MKSFINRLSLLSFIFLLMTATSFADEVRRDNKGFPICVSPKKGVSFFFKWTDKPLSRDVGFAVSSFTCAYHSQLVIDKDAIWQKFTPKAVASIDPKIIKELLQIEQKTNKLREQLSVEDYLAAHPIKEYTVEINRELTQKYGQVFSALVFRHMIESEKNNQELLQKVLVDLKNKNNKSELNKLKNKVRLVVSFGLGWEEKYNKHTPQYIKDFLTDIKSLGLPVTFLKKDPFGTVAGNIQLLIPQIEQVYKENENIIFISLCKGTPELFAAQSEILQRIDQSTSARVIGHVNLSGMLSGAIFSDFAKEIVLPKVVAPLLKLIPFNGIADSGKMVDAIEYMQSSIIEETLETSTPNLIKDIYTVNVTGAPMSTFVLDGNSPMKPVIKYGVRSHFIESANDGFLELPSTLVPKSISNNQDTLVLDSTHMLSDGTLHGYEIGKVENRRTLYQTIVKEIIKKDPLLAGLLEN